MLKRSETELGPVHHFKLHKVGTARGPPPFPPSPSPPHSPTPPGQGLFCFGEFFFFFFYGEKKKSGKRRKKKKKARVCVVWCGEHLKHLPPPPSPLLLETSSLLVFITYVLYSEHMLPETGGTPPPSPRLPRCPKLYWLFFFRLIVLHYLRTSLFDSREEVLF